ncbi:GIY-YIG nuclease family protein [Clostridium sp. Cult2]|uniref:GIY-YIG nuclease family protein n=1 Tax=Clostridium sp. Cult2 TaxID=2079003 RepID=UPI001F2A4C89|nr:GIY-YIG nuclease family protein [Clostridium sp. Cult2]MCF6465937.1 hypothetical protein [Clostridium sp. Cult2]
MNIPKNLTDKINSIPEKPGIYQMKDSKGNIIYIGKSKCLKKRVRSYFYTNPDFSKIKQMVSNIHDIDYIVTDTHLEAQLLECSLIKKLKPIYNSQYKNDKKYIYLIVEDYNRFNPLSISLERKNEYSFGPYRSRSIVMNLVELFKRLYPIKKGLESYEFTYRPIPLDMGKDDFLKNRECLLEIISQEGYLENFILTIKTKMEEASSFLKFERASYYRDFLSALKYLYNFNKIHFTKNRRILMGEKLNDGYKLFYIIDGNLIWEKKTSRINISYLESLLFQIEKLKNFDNIYIDEKSALDFKTIINRELKNNPSIITQSIDKDVDLELLMDFLQRLKV